MFYRSGGSIPVNPISPDELMLPPDCDHQHTYGAHARQSGRGAGQGGAARGRHDPHFLQYGHQHGAGGSGFVRKGTGADGGVRYLEENIPAYLPRARKRLYEVGDIVIDNHAPRGDGLLTIPGTQQIRGGASTFGSLFIAQRIVLKIENLYLAQGRMPPVLCSANLPGGDEYNTSAVAAYQGRIKALC